MPEPPATGEWTAATQFPADRPAVPGYEVLAELGRGGMGVVFKARQANSGRLVALKMIRDGVATGPHARARFRIEAEAAARMRHPNIVEVYEVGEHAGWPYLAMELVEGGTLDRHTGGRPQPPSRAAEVVQTLALAVAHAHSRNIVHRDLKPANILIAGDRKQETGDSTSKESDGHSLLPLTPKVSDFGLAKRLDSDSTAVTHDGAVLGTPGYMAPEQAAGRTHDIGPATDIYALGATLYELLTGRPPFAADSRDQTLQRVLNDDPDPPTRLQPGVPAALETVCLKCLEKEPARRYATAQELAEDLGRFLAGRPVVAVPPTPTERLFRVAERDGYRMIAEVGRGPRSVVYHARQVSLGQPVAVKVFSPGSCPRAEWEARLRRGAETSALLSHPHLVTVQRAGWWDGSPYLVTEYVGRGSLAATLGGQAYPVREAVKLVVELAGLVGYLHRQGVVHGNLKPGNVLLAADGIPRVADFRFTGGLFQSPLPEGDADPTGLGYLAPESVRDPEAEPRPHTDVYGLGVILYELLTGRPAFTGATGREVLDQVRNAEPPWPSRLNPEVPPALDAVCLRCLRKNPWRRFVRAYDLMKYLRGIGDADGRRGPDPRRPRRDGTE